MVLVPDLYKIYYINNTNIIHLEGKTIWKTENIRSERSLREAEFIFARNNFIFLLRWHKWHLAPNFAFRLLLPFFSDFIYIKLHRTPIKYHFSTALSALREALKLYKTHNIPKI